MTTSARAKTIRFDDRSIWVDLDDGRTLGVPLAWFPRLLHGSPAQRGEVSISPSGLHWEGLDKDISIAGLLAGRPAAAQRRKILEAARASGAAKATAGPSAARSQDFLYDEDGLPG